MLTEYELTQHRKNITAPISVSYKNKVIKRIQCLEPGDFIWIHAEPYTDFPVIFKGLTESNRIKFESFNEKTGKRFEDDVFYYLFMRTVTPEEINKIIFDAKNKLGFINS